MRFSKPYIKSILFLALIISSCQQSNEILFYDPLDGTKVKGWTTAPDSIINHQEYGRIFHLSGDSAWLKNEVPSVGDEKWSDYKVEFEMMLTEKQGFVGLDYNIQNKPDFGFNFHLSTFRDTITLQSMGMWGAKKGSWKLWPVSQKETMLPHHHWIKFRLETGNDISNIYVNDECIYTIYDIPFSSGGIRFFTSYGGSAFIRHLKVIKLKPSDIQPILPDPWADAKKLNTIRNWSVTELKPKTFANSTSVSNLILNKEKWREVTTDTRGVLNIGAIYPNYKENSILAKTVMNATQSYVVTCYLTYTDRFKLFCNGEEVFHGPDRNWWNPDREKYGNSRLIPDQYRVELALKKGRNEIIVRSEVMENFGWGFWMRTE